MSTKPIIRDDYKRLETSAWELDEFADYHFEDAVERLAGLREDWHRGQLNRLSVRECARVTELMGRITTVIHESME